MCSTSYIFEFKIIMINFEHLISIYHSQYSKIVIKIKSGRQSISLTKQNILSELNN